MVPFMTIYSGYGQDVMFSDFSTTELFPLLNDAAEKNLAFGGTSNEPSDAANPAANQLHMSPRDFVKLNGGNNWRELKCCTDIGDRMGAAVCSISADTLDNIRNNALYRLMLGKGTAITTAFSDLAGDNKVAAAVSAVESPHVALMLFGGVSFFFGDFSDIWLLEMS